MNEQNNTLDFILKAQQENIKNLLEGFKQLENKAYINATLSMGILVGLLTTVNNIKYLFGDAKNLIFFILLILSIFTLSTIAFSAYSLMHFPIINFFNFEYLYSILDNNNNVLVLKESLLKETWKNSAKLLELYVSKEKYFSYGAYLLFFELMLILGIIIVVSMESIWVFLFK